MNLLMSRYKQFRDTIIRTGNLPRIWQCSFEEDNQDQRLWFDKISKLNQHREYVEEIELLLKAYRQKRLTDSEKEQEFIEYINRRRMIPSYGEIYFSDNVDMYQWYMHYKNNHPDFEKNIYESLPEYREFDIAEVWPNCRREFQLIIKRFKIIPKHGQVKLSNGIDVNVIFNKLTSFDPEYIEQLLLSIAYLKNKSLSYEERCRQLMDQIALLEYIPYLQECRFSDGTDMYTWYNRYKEKTPELKKIVDDILNKEQSKRKINIYLIPEFNLETGIFYTICSNEGTVLDIDKFGSVSEIKDNDGTFRRRGGIILSSDEQVDNIMVTSKHVLRRTKKK